MHSRRMFLIQERMYLLQGYTYCVGHPKAEKSDFDLLSNAVILSLQSGKREDHFPLLRIAMMKGPG